MWTDKNVELLRKLWAEGKSSSQIAKAIGGNMTRNAVIGKVHRLGLRAVGASGRSNVPAPEPLRRLTPEDRQENEGPLTFSRRMQRHNLMVDIHNAKTLTDIKFVLIDIIENL